MTAIFVLAVVISTIPLSYTDRTDCRLGDVIQVVFLAVLINVYHIIAISIHPENLA